MSLADVAPGYAARADCSTAIMKQSMKMPGGPDEGHCNAGTNRARSTSRQASLTGPSARNARARSHSRRALRWCRRDGRRRRWLTEAWPGGLKGVPGEQQRVVVGLEHVRPGRITRQSADAIHQRPNLSSREPAEIRPLLHLTQNQRNRRLAGVINHDRLRGAVDERPRQRLATSQPRA